MFCACSVGSKIISTFKIDDGIKITADNYCNLLDKMFLEWHRLQLKKNFKLKCISMDDNAPSHSVKLMFAQLAKKYLQNIINSINRN